MTNEEKIQLLKNALDKLLRGIEFALDEHISRKVVSSRLRECRAEAIKLIKEKTK